MDRGRDNLMLDVRAQIASGRLAPGQRLPGTQEWARRHGISGPTAHKAMKALEHEGLVVRRPRSGTFVAASASLNGRSAREGSVGVVMDGHSHVFGKVQACLLDELQAMGTAVTVLNWNSKPGVPGMRPPFEEMAGCKPRAVIVHRDAAQVLQEPLRQLADTGCRIVVAFATSRHWPDRWCSVSPDGEAMTYLAVKHLLELGHRRVGFLGFQKEIHGRGSEAWPSEAEMGVQRAANDAGLPDAVTLFTMPHAVSASRDPEVTIAWVQENVLAIPHRPTGLVAVMDWRAVMAVRAAQRAGLSIPGDLSIAGQWNTPWAEAMELTSVSVREDVIAHQLAELSRVPSPAAGFGPGVHVLVAPELVVRRSTAAPGRGDETL